MAEAIEQFEIGGPSLVRAAAKNHAFTTIATDPAQYAEILSQVTAEGDTTLELRRRLAGEAFANTAQYDRAISDYFAAQESDETFPAAMNLSLRRKATLRYGENPHQQAALYGESASTGANLIAARQLGGKELSYNNLLDLDSALSLVRSLSGAAAVVLKHSNPCGAASAETAGEAIRQALAGDPLFGFRPTPGYGDYRKPIAGLYMCGGGTHPGGGVSGVPGRNCASVVRRDRRWGRLKFWQR